MNRQYYPDLDETVYRETLECGLQVAVIPRKGFTKKLAYLVTDFGSIHTEFRLEGQDHRVPAGIAHYLEHKLFDMPGGRDVSEEFAARGAMVNAFTSYDMTAYYFSCTEHFEDCLKLLVEFVFTPYFTEESVEKERGIIDQEIGMNLDTPDSVVFDELMKCLYENHPIRVPILGSRESIREITPETLYACHRAFYAPGNMLLCVVGDVEPEAVTAIARDFLGTAPAAPGKKLPFRPEPARALCPRAENRMEVAMPNFSMAVKFPFPGTGEAGIRQEMIADLAAEALFGESSELYLRLYGQGIIDSSFGGGFETVDGCAMLLCGGDSNAPEQVRDAVLAQAERLSREGLTQEEFLRLKRSALGRRIRALDSFDSTCFRLCAYHFSGFDYFRFPHIYRSLEERELRGFLALAGKPENCAISIIYPNIKEETL